MWAEVAWSWSHLELVEVIRRHPESMEITRTWICPVSFGVVRSRPESSGVIRNHPASSVVGCSRTDTVFVRSRLESFGVIRSRSRPKSSRVVWRRQKVSRVIRNRPLSSGVVRGHPASSEVALESHKIVFVRSRIESSGVVRSRPELS